MLKLINFLSNNFVYYGQNLLFLTLAQQIFEYFMSSGPAFRETSQVISNSN